MNSPSVVTIFVFLLYVSQYTIELTGIITESLLILIVFIFLLDIDNKADWQLVQEVLAEVTEDEEEA